MAAKGRCDPAFERVREVFAENFALRDEIGGAVCISVGGRVVVDLWGGHSDESRQALWERDTLVNAYSVGKGVAALLALGLVEAGQLCLDGKVTERWPEFAVKGKGDTTMRMLLCHQAGLPAIREPLTDAVLTDWGRITSLLARQAPFWKPGSAHGYHTNTFGFLVGELVCRATGRRFRDALRQRITGPLDADYHIGLSREHHARVAPVLGITTKAPTPEAIAMLAPPTDDPERDLMLRHCYFNPPGFSGGGSVNSEAWRLAEIPSTNGHGTARAIAAIYAAAIGGELGIGPELLKEARAVQAEGEDLVTSKHTRYGLGFQLSHEDRPIGRPNHGFGHYGHGGSVGFADGEAQLAFGYVTNLPGPRRWHQPRTQALVDAAYGCL